jgi:hypothetical protein
MVAPNLSIHPTPSLMRLDLVCTQIWLNYFVNDDYFGYVTKSLKKTLVRHVKHVQHSQKAMLEEMFNL